MVADVGAVEAGDDQPVVGNAELGEDVGAGAAVGGGGQREARNVAEAVEQRPQQAIVGAEIVAPFADAMGLVDREQGDLGFLEQLRKALAAGAFGGDVEQVELAVAERVADGARVFADAGQRGGANPERGRRADLVVHQRDQRRNDDPGTVTGERGQLVGQRLARAGRHHRERVIPRHRPRDDLFLDPAEGGKAETVVKKLMRVGHSGPYSRVGGRLQAWRCVAALPWGSQ